MRVEAMLKGAVRPVLPRGARLRTIPFGPARGLRMEIDFGDQARFWLGLFELELVPWIRRFCLAGSSAFDVGAREGYHTLVLAKCSAGGRVLALEADPAEHARLLRNIAANPGLVPTPETRVARVVDAVRVDGDTTLDDVAFSADGFVPDLVKLDIEGWEHKALQGAGRLLAERRPHLIVETHSADLERRCCELLAEAGYDPVIVEPRRRLAEVRSGHNRWVAAGGQR
jgi:methyltransferase FkbM-like protein